MRIIVLTATRNASERILGQANPGTCAGSLSNGNASCIYNNGDDSAIAFGAYTQCPVRKMCHAERVRAREARVCVCVRESDCERERVSERERERVCVRVCVRVGE